jgi:hypothetical protein
MVGYVPPWANRNMLGQTDNRHKNPVYVLRPVAGHGGVS